MAVKLNIVVASVEDVLLLYNRVAIYRAPSVGGTYVEITTAATRIPIIAGVSAYEYLDAAGVSTDFYKVRYLSTSSAAVSDYSSSIQGIEDSALDLITAQELKDIFLFGIDLTNDQGIEMPDSTFEFYIRSAVSWLELQLDIVIRPQVFVERHDQYPEDFRDGYYFLKTNKIPVVSVDSLEFWATHERVSVTHDVSTLHVDGTSGQIEIPLSGIPRYDNWAPSGYIPSRYKRIRDAYRITYTAGYSRATLPATIREVVGMLASFGPLNVFGDITLGAGLQGTSISLDGLSQSITTTNSSTNAGFGARILVYRQKLKEQIPVLQRALHPIGMVVV